MTAKVHLDHAHNLHLLKEMIRIRRFEEKCFELYQAEKIRGFLHLYDGEEAVSVGIMQTLGPEDAVVATYREHGQAIARGVPMTVLMAEMYGKLEGCCRGRGGSMHIFDRKTRFLGGNAIVGGGLPLAIGVALGDKMKGREALTACFFGDGAVDEGEFHESLNLASLWRLPVLFVCENNLYATGMRLERAEAEPDIHKKAECYRIPSEAVDGMDVVAVETAAQRAVESIRAGNGPCLMGEDVGRYGGCYAVTKGLLEELGDERIRDTPLSESAFVGAGIGAAIVGMRPIVEVMTCNFSLLALDQILNNAATIPHMSGGQFAVPLVIRMATGAGRQLAAQHSHSLEGWYAHIPGIKVLAPAVLEDARYMLKAALADPNPVLIFEHIMLYNMEGDLDPSIDTVDIVSARIRRPGRDVSLITYGGSLFKTLDAAAALAQDGIEAEVIDLRSLRPLDMTTVIGSVARTRRVVIVDEGWKSGSISAEIAMRIAEEAFFELDAPIRRVCSAEVPMPYAAHLEQAALPQPATIAAAARSLVRPA